MEIGDRAAALRQSALFRGLASDVLEKLAVLAQLRTVEAKQEVFHKGDEALELYAIVSGRARVSAPSQDGREFLIRTLEPVEVFGEVAIFDRSPRTASVVATEQCSLLVLQARDLFQLLSEQPEASLELLAFFAGKVRQTTEQLEDSVFLRTEARLAKLLLGLTAERGPADAAPLVTPPASQSVLAKMLGTTREGVNRQLSSWEKKGIIRRHEAHIELRDVDYLLGLVPVDLS
jgi:CRP/FNR family transcriptional regulator